MAKYSQAYDALCEAAGDVGWPAYYEADLFEHDRERLLGADAPAVFGWVLRECGTHLLDPRMEREDMEAYFRYLASRNQGDLFFWWDGWKLHSLSFEHWCVMLRQEQEQRSDPATATRY